MALHGITDQAEGEAAYLRAIYEHLSEKAFWNSVPLGQYLDEKIAAKARSFNTRLNNPDLAEQQRVAEARQQAGSYRKASKG
jgi:hypothetical protein